MLVVASFMIGIIIFVAAFMGMRQAIGLGALNQPTLDWMVSHRTDPVTVLMKVITSIANPYFFAFFIGVFIIIWVFLKRELWRPILLACSMAVAASTSTLLKTVFMDARPPQINMIPAFEYDFSFPSGHTIGMAVFLLVLGYLIYSRNFSTQRLWAWIAVALGGTGLIACSRLYLGYHWLTDILASIGLALIILAIVIIADIIFERKYKDIK
jgi:undecaprenyl-diphosphatase